MIHVHADGAAKSNQCLLLLLPLFLTLTPIIAQVPVLFHHLGVPVVIQHRLIVVALWRQEPLLGRALDLAGAHGSYTLRRSSALVHQAHIL